MNPWPLIGDWIRQYGRAALIRLAACEGSSPREAGATIAMRPDGAFSGTIGGGALEHAVLESARVMLAQAPAGRIDRHVLGPGLGQCCGGRVDVRIEVFDAADLDWIERLGEGTDGMIATIGRSDAAGRLIRARAATGAQAGGIAETFGIARTPLLLCGAGHVGRALVLALAPLPFAVTWVDPRAEAFPAHVPAQVRMVAGDPLAEIDRAPPGTLLAVFTHSHPLDLAIVSRALPDPRFAYVGLIGSQTKRARFVAAMQRAGLDASALDRLVCPIGGDAVRDKHPAVIAAMIAAELLAMREQG